MTEPAASGGEEAARNVPARRWSIRTMPGTPGSTVVVCSGPACTAAVHHPDDSVRRLGGAIAATSGGILVRALGCLGACPCAPVVVVNQRPPSDSARTCHPSAHETAGITVWVNVARPSTIGQLAGWIRAGGPGVAPMPADLDDAIVTIH